MYSVWGDWRVHYHVHAEVAGGVAVAFVDDRASVRDAVADLDFAETGVL